MRENRDAREIRLTTVFYENHDLPPLDRLDEEELDTLILMKSGTDEGLKINRMVNEDFARRHDFTQPVSWRLNELWVKVDDPAEAQGLKEKLRDLGYNYLETFMGSIEEDHERHWVLKGKITPGYFKDNSGRSKKLKGLFEGMGLKPMYVMAIPKMMLAEFEITEDTLDRIQFFMMQNKKHGLQARLIRNSEDAIDVVQMIFNNESDYFTDVTIPELRVQLNTDQSNKH